MRLTDALLGEHAVIYPLLDQLERAPITSAGEARAQAALLAAGLGSHARIEDELLFARLEAKIGAETGPLAVMRMEHDEIEGALANLERVQGTDEARRLATYLVGVARQHFAKEEQVLFPLAEEVLGREELERLGLEWATRRLG
jgi:iron-sulfur cluster repair protein YtfE (RIC family)